MAGAVLWLALCYQQENTLSENPRIRTPACVNMQKSYFLVKKAGRLVHTNEDEPLTELESTNPSVSGQKRIIRHPYGSFPFPIRWQITNIFFFVSLKAERTFLAADR